MSDVTDDTPAPAWPSPRRQLDAAPYWEGLAAGELRVQRCAACREAVWPANSFCPHCGGDELSWEVSSGRGAVYSFSTVVRTPTPAFAQIAPYTVGFIEMDDGYFLFAQIEGSADDVVIGHRVHVALIERGGQPLPVFRLTVDNDTP